MAYRNSQTIKRLIEYNAVKKRWKKINLHVYLMDTCIDRKALDPLVIVKQFEYESKLWVELVLLLHQQHLQRITSVNFVVSNAHEC